MSEGNRCPQCQAELPSDAPDGLCPKCLLVHGLSTAASPEAKQAEAATPSYRPLVAAPSPAELTGRFPQLEVLQLLGQGGMGAVYKARQLKLDRLVALKILPKEAGGDSAFTERFAREARALARLNHPQIVSIFDFGEAGGLYYFIMEYVDGMNLRQLLRTEKLTPAEAMKIVPQICEALQYAHDEGIVHRDIKPENILLDKKGRVKIADFGLAKLLGRHSQDYTLTGPWQVMGTMHYMAPEQIDAPLKVDHRADIYSLGVVFYEMLTGKLPLGPFQPPSQKVQVDARLDQVVLRALEREPDRRYQQASEVKTDVEAIGSGQETTLIGAISGPGNLARQAAVVKRLAKPSLYLMTSGVFHCVSAFALLTIGVAFHAYAVMGGVQSHDEGVQRTIATIFYLAALFFGFVGAAMYVGALRARRLESHGFVTTSAILGLLPLSPIWFLSFPAALILLSRLHHEEVQAAFRSGPRRLRPGPPALSPLGDRQLTILRILSLCGILLCMLGVSACFLPWVAGDVKAGAAENVKFTGQLSISLAGRKSWEGFADLIIFAAVGLFLITTSMGKVRRVWRSWFVLIGSLVTIVLTAVYLARDHFAELNVTMHWVQTGQLPVVPGMQFQWPDVSAIFEQAVRQWMVVSFQPGVYLALAASIGLLVVGLFDLRTRSYVLPPASNVIRFDQTQAQSPELVNAERGSRTWFLLVLICFALVASGLIALLIAFLISQTQAGTAKATSKAPSNSTEPLIRPPVLQNSVAVAPFSWERPGHGREYLIDLADVVISVLAQERSLNASSLADSDWTLPGADDPNFVFMKAGQRGVRTVLIGEILTLPNSLVVKLKLVDVQSRGVLESWEGADDTVKFDVAIPLVAQVHEQARKVLQEKGTKDIGVRVRKKLLNQ
jgi:tRNA A-37 threonylcarbamoyl transferase component Bud32